MNLDGISYRQWLQCDAFFLLINMTMTISYGIREETSNMARYVVMTLLLIMSAVYAMAPRSWQPDSSLGSTVDAHQAEQFLTDPAVQSLQMKTTEAEKALETSQEQTLSWSWGQDGPNSSGQERSTLQRVRTALRQQAFNQKYGIPLILFNIQRCHSSILQRNSMFMT